MARARNLKPGFFKNEVLATLEPVARIAFGGLWCVADRDGRLEDRPMRIKVEVLPYDNCDMDAILCDLEKTGFILRYEVNNIKYIQILNFEKHQSPHKNEAPSSIPAPCMSGAETINEQGNDDTNRPLTLNSDSLNSDSLNTCAKASQPVADRFDEFWYEYPKKKDKDKARKAWGKKDIHEIASQIIDDVRARKSKDADWLKDGGKFIPYPSTYLNGKRWEDDLTPMPKETGASNGKRTESLAEKNYEDGARLGVLSEFVNVKS